MLLWLQKVIEESANHPILFTRYKKEMGVYRQTLTEVPDDVVDGGLEQSVHGIRAHPQHALRRPLYKVHTTHNHREKDLLISSLTLIIVIVLSFFGTSKQKQNIVNANTQISNSREGV